MKFLFITIILSTPLFSKIDNSIEIDKQLSRNQMNFKTGKVDSFRHYFAETSKIINQSAKSFIEAYKRTDDRCDNSLKSSRRFSSKNYECKFHSEDVVESVKYKIITPGYSKHDYVATKYIKKQGNQILQQLITIKEEYIGGVKHYTIVDKSIDDKLSKKLTGKNLKFDATIKNASSTFIVKELSSNKIKVTYKYTMSTDHWLVNKSFITGRVFSSIEDSVAKLFKVMSQQAKTIKL